MGQHDEGFARHAAVLQLIAEELRVLELPSQVEGLAQCSAALETVAAALICAEGRLVPLPR